MSDSLNKPGRKSQFHELFCGGGDEILPEVREVLEYMISNGATDAQIAVFYGVSRMSLHRWKTENREFFKLFKDNKKIANDNVKQALYDRAVGYDFVETKLFVDKGTIIREEVIKHIPGDVSAQRYWLNNREPDEWKEQVHNTNENKNTNVPGFDLSNLSDAELDIWEALLSKVKPVE